MKKMKRYLMVALSVLMALPVCAQKTEEEYLSRYNMLVSRLGQTGVGVETLVTKWENDFPESMDMLCAKFSYY